MVSSVKWHFVLVIFSETGFAYDVGVDTIAALKAMRNFSQVQIDLYIDDGVSPVVVCRNGVCQNFARQEMIGKAIADFWSSSVSSVQAQHRFFGLHCHGNGFYLRHAIKVADIGTLLTGVSYADIIYLHSCHMATLESAFELKDKCRYYLASCGYRSRGCFLPQLPIDLDTPLEVAKEFATIIVQCANNSPVELPEITNVGDISVIDVRAISHLLNFMTVNTPNLVDVPLEVWKTAKLQRMHVKNRDVMNNCYDLWTFYRMILTAEKFAEWRRLFDGVVVAHYQTGRSLELYRGRMHGLAWCPCPWDLKYGYTYKSTSIYPLSARIRII
jgi:hypothetical protein